jgi:hypothetical protein
MLIMLRSYPTILRNNGIKINELSQIGYEIPINRYDNHFNTLRDIKDTLKENILDYYNIFIKNTNLKIETERLLSVYNVMNLPYNVYHEILKYLNIEVTRQILTGGSYYFSGKVGYLHIILRTRRADTLQIDCKASLDNLKALAKEKDINLYNKFVNKEIFKKDFIKQMKPYAYNKEHPERDKWITYYTDTVYPHIQWSKYTSNVKTKNFFKFVPSNYINTPNRSQIEFSDNAKTADEIIESISLGLRDKLFIYMRFNTTASLNYKKVIYEL